jgi:GNAT superfamily N-acetyltransferase
MEKTLTLSTRTINNIKGKLSALLRIVSLQRLAFVEMIVLETSSKISLDALANRAKMDIRLADNGDVRKFDRFEKFRLGEAEDRLKAGQLCFIAEKDGKIVNYTWISFHEGYVLELERKILIDPDSAYGYDEYTDPEYRGMGILPTVLANASEHLFQNGIKRLYELVSSSNFPSLRSHQKTGARKIGKVTLLRLFNSKRYGCKGETREDFHKLKEMFSI